MQKQIGVFLLFLGVSLSGWSQEVTNIMMLKADQEYDNILVKKMNTDSRSTSFIIWVKEGVKAHKHEHHTETLYVLSGKAEMRIGDKKVEIEAGDFFTIPQNTVHDVKVTSSEPLKVLSVQAPEFLGKDRVFAE